MSNKRYAVIGGGIAGLSAAIHLAAHGNSVTIFEKNKRVGGKLNQWSSEGFTFDTGPHVLTMLFALEELFEAAGKRLDNYMTLVKLPQVCRYHFPDGQTVDCPTDPVAAKSVLVHHFPGCGPEFDKLLEYAEDIYKKTTDTFLRQDINQAMKLGGPRYALKQMADFLSLQPFESLGSRIDRTFKEPRLRQIFKLYALYSGSHPYRCSSIFNVVAHIQWNLGTYYAMGGLYSLAEALEKILLELGVEIKTDSKVVRITHVSRHITGLIVDSDNGTKELQFDGVICNQDILTSNRLFENPSTVRNVEPSTSAFLLLLGIRGKYDLLSHHNSFVTGNEMLEYKNLFDDRWPPSDPTIGVSCQSVTDPSRAPSGMSNLFIMANVPALNEHFRWDEMNIAAFRTRILNKLEKMGLDDLSDRIVTEQVWTPVDFEKTYGSSRGAIYGLSSNGLKQAFFRPGQRDRKVDGVFYAGGSTHPGGGVPLCILSGKIAAEQLLENS